MFQLSHLENESRARTEYWVQHKSVHFDVLTRDVLSEQNVVLQRVKRLQAGDVDISVEKHSPDNLQK